MHTCTCTCIIIHLHSKRGSLSEVVLVNELCRPGVVGETEKNDLTEVSKTPGSPKVHVDMCACTVHCCP